MTEAGILNWLDGVSDRISPILIKEVRQMVRTREFNYTFVLALVAGLIIAFFGGVSALNGADGSGAGVFSSLMTCSFLLGLVIVPLGAFTAFRTERSEQTLDLVTLTALSARRIVLGKLWGQGVKLVTLFSGLAPFMAMSFLLGGIDLASSLIAIGSIFIWSLWACAACLFLSSISRGRAMSGVIFGAVGLLFFVIFAIGRLIIPSILTAVSYGVGPPAGFGFLAMGLGGSSGGSYLPWLVRSSRSGKPGRGMKSGE